MEIPKTMRRIGWMCFAAMWVPFTTLFIGMIGLPSGDYAWQELPALSRYSLVGVGMFFVATFFFLFGSLIVTWYLNRSVRSDGVLVEAEVLRIQDTGTTINNSPVVRVALEVRPDNEFPFEAEAEQLISRVDIPRYQPGRLVRVWYDRDSQAVALADDEEG